MRSPVLFLVFNRPDTTREVFGAIRAAKPPRLYVAADGPRPDREGEAERCAEVRRIATEVDWPCDLKTLLQDTNLGCKWGPVRGIDWFFENETEGVILEDDILPVPSFFPFCDELLERYRDDARVGLISGSNPIAGYYAPPYSYFFSHAIRIWGWAGWQRAWQRYDVDMRAWPEWRDQGGLESVSDGSRFFESHYRGMLDYTFRGGVDWWDYQWLFTCWYHRMFGVLPARNQIHNLGFGPDATHTIMRASAWTKVSIPDVLPFPLRHPPAVERDAAADRSMARRVNKLTFRGSLGRHLEEVKHRVRHVPVLGDLLKRVQARLRASLKRR